MRALVYVTVYAIYRPSVFEFCKLVAQLVVDDASVTQFVLCVFVLVSVISAMADNTVAET